MKMNKRKIFSDEFKTEAVRRVIEEGRTASSVGAELDVPRQLMGRWLKRARELSGEGVPKSRLAEDERTELERLRREVEQLKEEKEILKKAAAFFAKESL